MCLALDQELGQSEPTTIDLQTMLQYVAQDMKKSYPVKWTNEEFSKLLSVHIKYSPELLRYISNRTMNERLNKSKKLGMNPSTIQMLGHASADLVWADVR